MQEVIDPEWERIVENHRRDNDGRGRGQESRSTIWDYKHSQVKSDPQAAAARVDNPGAAEEKCSSNGLFNSASASTNSTSFSFVPSTNSAPEPSSPEVIKVDVSSSSRMSRARSRQGELKDFMDHYYMHRTSFILPVQPTQAKIAVEWIYDTFLLNLTLNLCAKASFSLLLILLVSRNGDAPGQGERRSRLSAFQQIWPQTYNSFQNRAVSAFLSETETLKM